jgi:23S rRNA pseudouridine2605 synthase
MNDHPPLATPANPMREGQRIAKVMARAGLCSRRDAESWIREGRVSVNGKVLQSPAFNVGAGDDVRVDGQPLKEPERTRLFLFHKPRGLVTTARDPEGRPTIFDSLPEDLPRVVAVGRLDINTEGLILLTNDGGLARVLELPATAWLRRYRVRAHGAIEQARLDALREGVTIEGVHYVGIEAKLEREQGSNVWIMMGLREGKNREIKRVLEHLGLSVNRLIRVSFGPFELGDLAEGEVAEVRTRVLRDQLGAKLAREAGVNFDAEVVDHAAPAPPPPVAKRGERRWAGGRERPDRGGSEPRGAPKRREPEPSQAPRRHKHVSALRAEVAADAKGPRKRIERSATSDRKGREVKVERIVATPEELRRRAAETARRDRSRQRGAERRSERGESASPDRRGGKPFEKRASSGEDRGPSREGGKPFGKRPPSGEGRSPPRGEGRPFEKRASSGEGRPPSREGGKPFGKRPPSGTGRSPPRGEGRPFDKRAASGEGRPPSRGGGKPFGKRPPSGEGRSPPRGGKTGGKRPPRRP